MVDSRECFLYVASMARRGRRGGYFSLQNLFALNSRLHGNLQHALRLSVCVCLRVCGSSHAICKSYAQHILKIQQQQQQERQRQQQQQQRQVHKTWILNTEYIFRQSRCCCQKIDKNNLFGNTCNKDIKDISRAERVSERAWQRSVRAREGTRDRQQIARAGDGKERARASERWQSLSPAPVRKFGTVGQGLLVLQANAYIIYYYTFKLS